jgi:hypothetical protein
VYAPAGVPAGTLTLPVNGSKAGTGAPPMEVAGTIGPMVLLPAGPTVAGAPLTVSFVRALPTLGLPVMPLMPVKLSVVATIGAGSTVMLAVVVLQFAGLSFSHKVYVML